MAERSHLKLLIFGVTFLVILLIVAGLFFYHIEEKIILEEKTSELKAIAELKIHELRLWRQGRQRDAEYTSRRPRTIQEVRDFISHPEDSSIRKIIAERLEMLKRIYQYDEVDIVDRSGKVLFSTEPKILRLDPSFLPALTEADTTGLTRMSDFNICSIHQKVHVLTISPLIDQGKIFAFLVLQDDPANYLYPLIQNWPANSETAETILFEQDGDSVFHLNELRHLKKTALKLRIPLTDTMVPAVKAIRGATGIVEGTDYRGKKVYAYISRIEDTPWFMISKMDRSEMFREARIRGIFILALLVIFISFVILLSAYFYHVRQKNKFEELYKKEKLMLGKLAESEAIFKSVFESSNVGKSLTHVSGSVEPNAALCAMLGYTKEELELKRWQDLTPPEEIAGIEEIIDALLSGEADSARFYKRYIRKDGSMISADVSTVIRRDEQGKPLHFITNIIDISEQVRSTEALRKSEERFAIAFRSSPYAITLTKANTGEITDVNKGFVKITGYSREEVLGNTTVDLNLWENIQDRKDVVSELMQKGEVRDREFSFRIKNGTIICGIFSAELILIDNERFVLSSINDITKRKKIEDELVTAKEKAVESEQLKSIFLANMSHEIRTPMNAILGFSSLMNDASFSEEEREVFMHRIQNAGQRLLQIINDIIDISKLESSQLKIHKEPCQLADLLYHSLDEIQTSGLLNKKPGVTLAVDLPGELENMTIMTDGIRVQQVITNLLSNAAKFTKEGTIIAGVKKISEDEKHILEFYIKDTGKGIPPEKLEMIFERFRQAEEKEYHQGTGLGLSITKGIIEVMGGTIRVSSHLNQGTTFYFTIPCEPVAPVEPPSGDTPSLSPLLKGKVIVIAEDNHDSYLYLKNLLTPTQATLVHCPNGEKLMHFLSENHADLIILDLKMPRKSGLECLKEIRQKKLPVRVIVQTAYAFPDDKQQCMEAGSDAYLAKPFDKTDLLDKVRKVMSRS